MTQTAINYARALYDLKTPRQAIMDTKQAFLDVPELAVFFSNPVIAKEKKFDAIERIFPQEMKNFLKVLCGYQSIGEIGDIFEAYEEQERAEQNKILVKLSYVTAPSETQLRQIKDFLCKEFEADEAEVIAKQEPELLGGFVLLVGNKEYDWSIKGRFQTLKQKLTWR